MDPIKAAQDFLSSRIQTFKEEAPRAIKDVAWSQAHPVLGAVNMISQSKGGPSLEDGFRQGVTSTDPTKSKGYSINLPAMPF